MKGQEFGPKPFDPFYRVPESQNEDDEWLMPVADPYDFAGNDIIDASGLFAWIACNTTSCPLPTVGFTAYGGEGDDLIIGSQAGDHLAGGSGDDTILGLRGTDHIYGDGGINVDIFTRGLAIEFVEPQPGAVARPADHPGPMTSASTRRSSQATSRSRRPRHQPRRHAGRRRRHLRRGRDQLHGRAHVISRSTAYDQYWTQTAYDDIVFGDHGTVFQQVADTNEPDPRLQKIQTTTIGSVRGIESRAFQNGGDDTINGNLGRDLLVGGAGDDMADGDEQDDMVFGDNIFLLRRVGEPPFPTRPTTPARSTSPAGASRRCAAT